MYCDLEWKIKGGKKRGSWFANNDGTVFMSMKRGMGLKKKDKKKEGKKERKRKRKRKKRKKNIRQKKKHAAWCNQ